MAKPSIYQKFSYVINPILYFIQIKLFTEFFRSLANTIIKASIITGLLSNESLILRYIDTLITPTFNILLSVYVLTPYWKRAKGQLPIHENKEKPLMLAIGTIIIYCGIKWLTGYLIQVTYLSEHPKYLLIVEARSNRSALEMFVKTVIAAPIVEELLFRGVLQNRLMALTRPSFAVLFQSIAFCILHMNLVQALYVSLSSIIYGILYVRFRKLWPCILAHAVFNSNLADWLLQLTSTIVDEITLIHVLIIGSIFTIIGTYILLKQPSAQPVNDAIKNIDNNTYLLMSHAYH